MIEEVKGLTVPSIGDKPGALFPYQLAALNQLMDSGNRFLFANHGTGTGKTLTACATIQHLFNEDLVDEVLFFTTRKMKINISRAINKMLTNVYAIVPEGTKARRRKQVQAGGRGVVLVLNYERANFDFELLSERIRGKRVLFVCDEVQKILVYSAGKPNKAGQGLQKLFKLVEKECYFLPMSATTINNNPERYYRLFDYVPNQKNPMGGITAFRKDYTSRINKIQRPWGIETEYVWDKNKLSGIRDVVGNLVHTVRKTDPEVAALFKSTEFEIIPVQLSEHDRALYDLVLDAAEEDGDHLWGPYFRILEYICNTVESLKHSKSAIAQEIAEAVPGLSSNTSSKMETLIDHVLSIRDQEDKVVVFTKYTNLGLFLIADSLTKAGIKHVVHYGTGMTSREAQAAQDEFKSDPSITVFLSSDAGAMGLSFQEARYVINYDVPKSYDILTQRNDRIDRADSYLDGLTSYVYICEDTFEERAFRIMNERRDLASAIQGTDESLSRSDLKYLMFDESE